MYDTLFVDFVEDVEQDNRVVLEDDEGGYEKKDKGGVMTGDASQSHVAKLVVGSLSNIIATGKIDEVPAVERHEQTIYGVRLGGENTRVSITQVIDGGSAKIPFPVGDEIMTVHQDNDTVKFLSTPKVRRVFLIFLASSLI